MSTARTFAFLVCLGIASMCQPIPVHGQDLPEDLAGDSEARGFADLLFSQGMVALAGKDYAEALPLFEKAAEARPGEATYRYFVGFCKLRLGRLADAIADLQATLPPAANRVSEARVRYDLGEGHYRADDLPAARRELERSIGLDDSDAWAHFHLGLVLFAQGEMDRAAAAFGRAGALDPSLTEGNAYYLGVAAFEAGDREAARAHFEQALQAEDTPEATGARQWLSSLDAWGATARPPRFAIRAGLSIEHDDNPGQINEDIVVPDVAEDERAVLDFRLAYAPIRSEQGLNVGLAIDGYASSHNDFEVADLKGAQGVISAAWGADPLGFWNGPLGFARVSPSGGNVGLLLQAGAGYFYLNDASYRRDQLLAAGLFFRQPGLGKTQVELLYDDIAYLDGASSAYTGDERLVRVSQYIELGRPERYLRLGVAHGETSTELNALEHETDQVLAELAWPFAGRWIFFLAGSRQEDDYDEASAAFYGIPDDRDDTRKEATGKLSVSLHRHGYLTLQYRWVDRESEVAALSYDRRIASVGYTVHW